MNSPQGMKEYSPRTVTEIVSEVVHESWEFVETRFALLRAELSESRKAWTTALPVLATAALFLFLASVLFTFAFVSLIYVALPENAYRWFFALGIVGFLWTTIGALTAYSGLRAIREHSIVPRKTLGILRADKEWLENERRAA